MMNNPENLPMCLPKCPHHTQTTMVLRPLARQAYEQKWCGTWYDCPQPFCDCSILFPSKQLQEFHRNPNKRNNP